MDFESDNDDIGLCSELNWLNERPYSRRCKELLAESEHLPIMKWKNEFSRLLEENRVVLVNTESGAGKTTQIPQFCLRYVWQKYPGKKVVCSVPSTLAAQHAAQRVSEELDVKLGDEVAYHVRYDETEQPAQPGQRLLLYCTDGYLRNLVANNRVRDYAVIVVDDVHERSINIDMLIGLLKPILEYPDSKIRLVLLGARLTKVADFYAYFAGIATATLEVPGRQHNVEIEYYVEERPSADEETPYTRKHPYLKRDRDSRNYLVERCVAKAMDIHQSNFEIRGDILLILPGKDDILIAQEQLMQKLDNECVAKMDVLPLYANMPEEDSEMLFRKHSSSDSNLQYVRRCILSTGIVDSYLDLKDIVHVVDSGQTKQQYYNERTKQSSIAVQNITKAIAQKRAGLAGRFQDGFCYRIYSETTYKHLIESDPEIKHGNMCSYVLKFIEMRIPIATFEFIEKPVQPLIDKAIKTLKSIGAIDTDLQLLKLGDRIKRLRLPLDPPLAAMLIKSAQHMRIYEELVMLAAMLDSPQPWHHVPSPAKHNGQNDGQKRKLALAQKEKRELAYAAWDEFKQPHGDHFTLLEVFRRFSQIADADKKKWCNDNYLLFGILKQANNLHKELMELLQINGRYTFAKVVNNDCLRPIVKMALLHGFPLQVAYFKTRGHGFCRRAEEGYYIPADAELDQEQLTALDKWGGYNVHGGSVYARGRGCGIGSGWVLFHRTNGRQLLTVTGLVNTAMLLEDSEVYGALTTYANEEFKRRLAALKEEEELRAAAT